MCSFLSYRFELPPFHCLRRFEIGSLYFAQTLHAVPSVTGRCDITLLGVPSSAVSCRSTRRRGMGLLCIEMGKF